MSRQRSTARVARRSDTHSNSRKLIDHVVRSHRPRRATFHYWRLIDAIRSKTGWLTPNGARNGEVRYRRVALACKRLACTAGRWIRQPEFWGGTDSASLHRQWCDFVSHLLHAYDSPLFLAPIWMNTTLPIWHQKLHFHIAKGMSVRRFEYLPINRLSKSVARWFMQAPDDATIDSAIRWAQIRALGGDAKLSRLLMNNYAIGQGESWEHSFHGTVDFIVRNQPLCKEEALAIAQFAIDQRFRPARETVGPWMGENPIDDRFDLRGWTLRRLRRHMTSWRDRLPSPCKHDGWTASTYQPFEKHAKGKAWRIVELCKPYELRKEGQMMNHCIATYVPRCRRRTSSVWSLRYALPNNHFRSVMTIDVDPRCHVIREVNGKSNSRPADIFLKILDEWASREGLKLSKNANYRW